MKRIKLLQRFKADTESAHVCVCVSGTKSRYVDVLNPGRAGSKPAAAVPPPADLFAPLAPMAMPANLFTPAAGVCLCISVFCISVCVCVKSNTAVFF